MPAQSPGAFRPAKLNTSNWVASYKALGAREAVLTAKHGCGFVLWDTAVTLPNGEVYPYGVKKPGAFIQTDVVGQAQARCCAPVVVPRP